MLLALRQRFRLLALFPALGHAREDLADDSSVRFWAVHAYLVAFVPETRPLSIVRILHGARDPGELRGEIQGQQE